jgi:hypothetical protein
MEASSQLNVPSALPPGKNPQILLDRRLGGPRVDLDDMEKKFLTLPGLELRPFGRPARNQLLYLLRHPSLSET